MSTSQTRGVALRSLTEQMATTTPQGAFLVSGFGALAQYERALTQERVRAGLAAVPRRGKRGGRVDPARGRWTHAGLTVLSQFYSEAIWGMLSLRPP
jgi:DNA invertase Pin-like site-specific DNA recombinase